MNTTFLRTTLLAIAAGITIAGCQTTDAYTGEKKVNNASKGAGIGAATHSNVGRSAAIGAGVGGTAGALYDIFGCCRSSNRRGYDD
jgi:tetrahydromethanopterin S-methyltransferase subunit E